jgi:hypothetical protein
MSRQNHSNNILLGLIDLGDPAYKPVLLNLLHSYGKPPYEVLMSSICRSHAYRDGEGDRLLELVIDMKNCKLAELEFVMKYTGDIYGPLYLEIIESEFEFLDEVMIPTLKEIIA